MSKRYDNNRILVFTDPHLPYEAKGMMDHLRMVKSKYKPDRVICTGDLVDNYNASRYAKDPDHPDSWPNEMMKVRKRVHKLGRLFPDLVLTRGNHDERYYRKASTSGIPTSILKGFNEIIGAPEGWNIVEEITLTVDSSREQITFCHHKGANPLLVAQRLGRSLVSGHMHSKCKIECINNGERTYYGVNVPSYISNLGAPFQYAKQYNINPIRGCLMIVNGVPQLEIM